MLRPPSYVKSAKRLTKPRPMTNRNSFFLRSSREFAALLPSLGEVPRAAISGSGFNVYLPERGWAIRTTSFLKSNPLKVGDEGLWQDSQVFSSGWLIRPASLLFSGSVMTLKWA